MTTVRQRAQRSCRHEDSISNKKLIGARPDQAAHETLLATSPFFDSGRGALSVRAWSLGPMSCLHHSFGSRFFKPSSPGYASFNQLLQLLFGEKKYRNRIRRQNEVD